VVKEKGVIDVLVKTSEYGFDCEVEVGDKNDFPDIDVRVNGRSVAYIRVGESIDEFEGGRMVCVWLPEEMVEQDEGEDKYYALYVERK